MRLHVGLRRRGRTSTPHLAGIGGAIPLGISQPAGSQSFLTLHDVTFRKTHDLNELGGQCAALNPSLAPLFKDASDLTDYAVVFRYLDAPREPDESEAMAARETAGRVVEEVSALLAPL